MISTVLKDIKKRVEKFVGVVLIGVDGFPVDRIIPNDSNLEQVVIEHVAIIKKITQTMKSLDLGGPVEMAIIGDEISLIFRSVTPYYFLALGVEPDSSIGRARYELRRASIPLTRELTT